MTLQVQIKGIDKLRRKLGDEAIGRALYRMDKP